MTPRVAVICVSDRPALLPVLLHALRAQTFHAWQCVVLDQGAGASAAYANRLADVRIRGDRVPFRGDWGQTAKALAAEQVDAEYLVFPNDDVYYAPPFLEKLVAALDAGHDLAYCDWIFDKFGHCAMTAQPQTGWIDVGGFMVRKAALLAVGWTDRGDTGDGRLVERLVAAGVPHTRVPGFFYVKN